MKISPDQNTITLDDGVVLVAAIAPFSETKAKCEWCYLKRPKYKVECHSSQCSGWKRIDETSVIFIKEQKND